MNPGTSAARLQSSMNIPIEPISAMCRSDPCPTMSSRSSFTPTPMGFERKNSMDCCVAPGLSTDIRPRSQRKKTTPNRKTTNSIAKKLGIGYCGFVTGMCSSANKASAGFANSQLTSFVTPRICSSPMNLQRQDSSGLFRKPELQRVLPVVPVRQLVHKFQHNCRDHRDQTAQKCNYRQPQPSENNIRYHEQQHEPPEELCVNHSRHMHHFRACLRHSQEHQRARSLPQPAKIQPAEGCSDRGSFRGANSPSNRRCNCHRRAQSNDEVFQPPFDRRVIRVTLHFSFPRRWRF